MKNLIIIFSFITLIFGGFFAYQGFFGDKNSDYEITLVKKGEVNQLVSVIGTVVPAKEIDLEFEKSGKIKEVLVEKGDKVNDGQELIKLETGELNAQLAASQASLELAQAKLEKTLAGTQPEEIEVYKAAVEIAETDVKNKEQILEDIQETAQNDLNNEYEEIPYILIDAYREMDDALSKQVDDLFSSENTSNPDLTFKTSNSKLEITVKNQRSASGNYLDDFKEEIDNLNNNDRDSLIQSLENAKTYLTYVSNFLIDLTSLLNNAIAVSASTLSTYKASVDTARTNVGSALNDINDQIYDISSTKLTNQSNINTAQANLEAAKSSLAKAKEELTLKKSAPRQVDIELAQAELRESQARFWEIQEKINKSILKSSSDGIVIAVEKETGETAQANQTILSIINEGKFQIEANVSETEIDKVKLGNEVGMTLDSLGPEEEFSGKVIKIDPSETIVSGVIYYQIKVLFDSENSRIKSGMTVNLNIKTNQKENVLCLPYYLIKNKDSYKYVLVLKDNNETEERKVKIGLEGENEVEILEGLKEGEKVIYAD